MALLRFILVLTLCSAFQYVHAQSTPVGLWKTFDEETSRETALIRVRESTGVFTGTVERLLEPHYENAVCEKCTDERKGKLVLGMVVLSDVRQSPDDAGIWAGGSVLDVKQGKVFKAQLKLANNGQTLEVRGYVGTPILGRTRSWQRVE